MSLDNQTVEQLNKAFLIAVQRGHVDVIETLLFEGAEINTVDDTGGNAVHIAAQNCDLAVLKLLLEKGANFLLKDNSGKYAVDYAKEEQYFVQEVYDFVSRNSIMTTQEEEMTVSKDLHLKQGIVDDYF